MFSYNIKKSLRARHMRITVQPDGIVTVTIPQAMSERAGRLFAQSKQAWIDTTLIKVKKQPKLPFSIPRANAQDYRNYKENALLLVRAKLEYFNAFYKLSWKKIAIKNTSSRWGSCSRQGNLNFNYRIIFLPEEYRDYLIVHELCHLQEFNHSRKFWQLVEKCIPAYRELQKQMRAL